jgi:TonB family protein
MESLNLSPRRLSREDVLTGVGGSVLVHALVISFAIIGPFTVSKKTVQNPFWTVNLVTAQDFGLGTGNPARGTTVEGGSAVKSQGDQKGSTAARSRSGPLVPVRRLQMGESTTKTDTDIKKMETAEVPKFSTNTQSVASVEKNLEKLINKPKSTERSQVAGSSNAEGEKNPTAPSSSAHKNVQEGSGAGQTGERRGVADSRQGGAKGEEKDGSQQGGPRSSADGAQVGLARRLYYTEIWNAIRRQWALPEFLKSQHLETVLVVVVRRDGKVLDLRVEKSSGNDVYDESARRAVRKAEPLPPFPAIYSPAQEEIGLRFRPEDLS